MKKLLAIVLAMVMVLALAACGSSGSSAAPAADAPAAEAPAAEAPAAEAPAAEAPAADGYPKGTITIICPFSAGGGTDLMARALAPEISERLGGVSVIVENKTGGSGAIAMNELKTAKPDGYTLAIVSAGPTTLTPNNSDVGYTNVEFTPICQVSTIPIAFFVRADSGIESLEDLLTKAEENPGTMTYGTSGAGLIQHVTTEMFLQEIDKRGLFTHVPFDGGTEAVTALLGGQVDFCVGDSADVSSFMDEGELICIAVTAEEPDPMLPGAPTLKELGYETVSNSWWGFAAPAGTPDEIIHLLDETIRDCMEDPDIIEIFDNLDQPIDYAPQEEFTEMWMTKYDIFHDIIAGLQ